MSDEDQALDSTSEVNEDEAQEAKAEETLKIGDQELSLQEAKELIEQGKTLKQLQDKYPNVDFEEMVPSFTQKSQRLAELEKKMQPEPEKPAAEREREMQIRALANDPVFREELVKMQEDREKKIREDLAMEKRLEELEAEFDGTNGEPKFDKVAVLKYGMQHQIYEPRVAYKAMHEKEFEELAAKRALSKRQRSTYSERRGGMGSQLPSPKRHSTIQDAERAFLERIEADNY